MTAPQLNRRLLAILAADVVGYSRLMDADEPGTIARLKAVRSDVLDPLVVKHRGHLVKLMGDGALVTFDSVVDAIAAVPEAERMVFRVGVNLGDVALVDNDIYGEGVNVAARLEQLCEPGGVVVSGTAFDQLQGKLDVPVDFVGEQKVKNIARPVRAYRVRLMGPRKRFAAH
jgi:class 3 adenylate cyclase